MDFLSKTFERHLILAKVSEKNMISAQKTGKLSSSYVKNLNDIKFLYKTLKKYI